MLNLRTLPNDLARKAAAELHEDPDKIAFYLSALREWLEKQPHLRARITDQFLIAFLRGTKFSLEKAKQKLENFYTYRAMLPELYQNRNLSEPKFEAIVRAGAFSLLEPIATDGPIVVFVRPSHFDMEAHNITDVLKVAAMMVDILLEESDNAIIAGYVFIMDLGNIPKAVLLNFEPEFIKKLTVLANKAAPTRMKGFHFLNVLPIFEKLFGMVKSVISSKLKERVRQWKNFKETYCKENPDILPKYWYVLITVMVWFPLGVMLICYSAIFYKLDRYEKRILSREHPLSVSYKKTVAKTLFIVVVVFIVLRLPFTILVILRDQIIANSEYSVNKGFQIFSYISQYLMFLNAAVNPLIYGFNNDNFRRAYEQTPLCKCCRRNTPIVAANRNSTSNFTCSTWCNRWFKLLCCCYCIRHSKRFALIDEQQLTTSASKSTKLSLAQGACTKETNLCQSKPSFNMFEKDCYENNIIDDGFI